MPFQPVGLPAACSANSPNLARLEIGILLAEVVGLGAAHAAAFGLFEIHARERGSKDVKHKSEISDDSQYRRIREKAIGMTFGLVEQSSDALRQFIVETESDEARDFFKKNADSILVIFSQSGTQNLRILDRSLQSWVRIYEAISPDLKKRERGIEAAFQLFLALSIEARAGRIVREDLNSRAGQIARGYFSKGEDKAKGGTPLSEAQDRYGRIPLNDRILTDEVLSQILYDGGVDPE